MSNSRYCVQVYLNVSAFQGKSKPCFLILDKVQCHFGVAFLLQVSNDGLTNELGIAHHVKHFVVLAVDKRQLELVLGGVNAEHSWTTFAVQAVDVVSFHAGDIDWQIQCSNDSMVTTSTENLS